MERQVREKVDLSSFKWPVLMNRRSEMGGIRVERQQYRRWRGSGSMEVPPPCYTLQPAGEVNTRAGGAPGGMEELEGRERGLL